MKKCKKAEVQQQPVVLEAQPVVMKQYLVNCPRCGAALKVQDGGVAYMCPVCSNLFRMRTGAKLVKDVTRVIVSEAYVNVSKGVDEE